MPRGQRVEQQQTITSAQTLTTTAETVVATVAVATDTPDDRVDLAGQATLLSGTGTTQVRLRIRRGSLTGTVVADSGNMGLVGSVGSIQEYDLNGQDTPGEYDGPYVLTAAQVGASANGTVQPATLQAVF